MIGRIIVDKKMLRLMLCLIDMDARKTLKSFYIFLHTFIYVLLSINMKFYW